MRKIQNIVLLTLTVMFLSMLVAAPALAAKPLHHGNSSGGGLFHAPGGNEGFNLFVFAFDAHQLEADGEATGHFLQNNLTNGNVLHLDIIHMEFMNKGNSVGLVGLVTKSIGSNAEIGDCRAVLLQDNVKNSEMRKDMRSKLSSKCDPPDFSNANHFQLYGLDDGHIQIR
jgi:hypothetical protein